MKIKELAERTNLSESAIRYYESVGLLPKPHRLTNGYRDYAEADVARAKFVAGARSLDLSLDDVREILALRDRGEAPCRTVLALLEDKANEIRQRIYDLKRLEAELRALHDTGLKFPLDDVEGKHCVCHLVQERS